MSGDDAIWSEQFKDGFNRFLQFSEYPERTFHIFVLMIFFMAGSCQEHQDEKSESPVTTDDLIELRSKYSTNWQQSCLFPER
jgi:hypothetical protein